MCVCLETILNLELKFDIKPVIADLLSGISVNLPTCTAESYSVRAACWKKVSQPAPHSGGAKKKATRLTSASDTANF